MRVNGLSRLDSDEDWKPPSPSKEAGKKKEDQQREEHVLHPLGTPGPVTVMEIKPLALENKGAHAILKKEKKSVRK